MKNKLCYVCVLVADKDKDCKKCCTNEIKKLFSQQDNSRKEWAFKKAITIQTYCNYNPIPVPHNIISTVAMKIYGHFRKNYKKQNSEVSRSRTNEFCIPLVQKPLGMLSRKYSTVDFQY